MSLREDLYTTAITAREKHPEIVESDLKKMLYDAASKGKMDLHIPSSKLSSDGMLMTGKEIQAFASKEGIDFRLENNGGCRLSFSSLEKES